MVRLFGVQASPPPGNGPGSIGVRHGYFMAKTHASYDMTYDVHS